MNITLVTRHVKQSRENVDPIRDDKKVITNNDPPATANQPDYPLKGT